MSIAQIPDFTGTGHEFEEPTVQFFHHQVAAVSTSVSMRERAEMDARLPAFVQPFLTWLTACPAAGEEERRWSAGRHLWFAVLVTALGTVGSGALVSLGGWFLAGVPLTLLATTNGLGRLQAVIYHHCAHGTVLGTARRNAFVGNAISIVLSLKSFTTYRAEHLRHHNAAILFTPNDEFFDFCVRVLGFAPGAPTGRLWRQLLLSLFSPVFHARFLAMRIKSCVAGCPVKCALLAAIWGTAIAVVGVADAWIEFAVGWLLPATVLLQVTTVFRILCEHRIPEGYPEQPRDRAFVCAATAGFFLGIAVPQPQSSRVQGILAWGMWWTRMCTGPLLARIAVLVGDAPAHDFHHRYPMSRSWTNATQERARDADAGCPAYPHNYIDYWGVMAAVSDLLNAFSRLPSSRSGEVQVTRAPHEAARPARRSSMNSPALAAARQ